MSKEKKTYQKPTLNTWGTVADLTKTGQTHPGADGKSGSVVNPGQ
ncbi:MAG TPA: hypothetical protein VF177_17605 [Anaerolineae bacterium]